VLCIYHSKEQFDAVFQYEEFKYASENHLQLHYSKRGLGGEIKRSASFTPSDHFERRTTSGMVNGA
jgi:hypothetical protein